MIKWAISSGQESSCAGWRVGSQIEIIHRRLEISKSPYVPPQISLKLQHRSFPEAAGIRTQQWLDDDKMGIRVNVEEKNMLAVKKCVKGCVRRLRKNNQWDRPQHLVWALPVWPPFILPRTPNQPITAITKRKTEQHRLLLLDRNIPHSVCRLKAGTQGPHARVCQTIKV